MSSGFDQKRLLNTGKWDATYERDLGAGRTPGGYGNVLSYVKAAEFFSDLDEVEDWGCGKGGFTAFWPKRYVGIDGSATPFADKVVDLTTYTSSAEGILLRHVLEHNALWEDILTNAVASFRRKLCIVLFTPFSEVTRQLAYYEALDVPDISFAREDITRHLSGMQWRMEEYGDLPYTQYGVETLFYVERP